jgi:hypothetical protein
VGSDVDAGERRLVFEGDNRLARLYIARPMILTASQFDFWYFGYPTPLAPAEDRLA